MRHKNTHICSLLQSSIDILYLYTDKFSFWESGNDDLTMDLKFRHFSHPSFGEFKVPVPEESIHIIDR